MYKVVDRARRSSRPTHITCINLFEVAFCNEALTSAREK
mgnify:FL=1